ncbi:hypothetical protein CORC01_12301 [Colletotrichum orchidophilum]|uniref:Uncharacterized protein n=1 Tax=Colletotrichum orchidophilum TaxID=1209926 RepID=A0A1G4AT85_9PEZI|nr:uncharacterized protein CORC01_12301 [Colletotrichum orchidophilum]OHE92374.1 hypothetical protein CORC01_12301 [Colletotrichum orchidophilum]
MYHDVRTLVAICILFYGRAFIPTAEAHDGYISFATQMRLYRRRCLRQDVQSLVRHGNLDQTMHDEAGGKASPSFNEVLKTRYPSESNNTTASPHHLELVMMRMPITWQDMLAPARPYTRDFGGLGGWGCTRDSGEPVSDIGASQYGSKMATFRERLEDSEIEDFYCRILEEGESAGNGSHRRIGDSMIK